MRQWRFRIRTPEPEPDSTMEAEQLNALSSQLRDLSERTQLLRGYL
jgi:hypothetical protein